MNLKSFSLTIMDFLGIILPGFIWLLVSLYIFTLYPNSCADWQLVLIKLSSMIGGEQSTINIVLLFILSYIAGYLSRLIPPKLIDYVSLPFAATFTYGKAILHAIVNKEEFRKLLLPYDFNYANYAESIRAASSEIDSFTGKSNVMLYDYCKTLLLENSYNLWLYAERREAEIRLICCFFFAAAALLIAFLFSCHFISSAVCLGVLVCSLVIFRIRRKAEVSYVYRAAHIILNKIETQNKDAKKDTYNYVICIKNRAFRRK